MSLIDAKERLRGGVDLHGALDSPCLSMIYSALSAGTGNGKVRILSTGVLSQSLLDYFKQFHCDIWVLDIFNELVRYQAATEQKREPDQTENKSSGKHGRKSKVKSKKLADEKLAGEKAADERIAAPAFPQLLDIIEDEEQRVCNLLLMWDYFNYLNHKTIQQLMDQLSKVCAKDALLYFFTTLRGNMPSSPGEFHLRTSEQIEYVSAAGTGLMRSPEYSTNQLVKLMPSFSIVKLSRLGNGILQENLFRFNKYKPPQDLKYRFDLQ